MTATNVYSNINELIKDYYSQPTDDYLNQTVTINEVTLTCDIYRVDSDTELTASVFTGCTAVDANTQIIIGSNLSVANGTTLTPPYRCKGVIIGCPGSFTNEGIISMTARGASGEGKNIQLTTDYMISAVGGAGGASVTSSDGANGSTAITNVLSCAGGGSGGSTKYSSYGVASGAGGAGTSFSGGAGGGGSAMKVGASGSSTGGAGGNGGAHNSGYGDETGGGAGNPGGTGDGSNGATTDNKGADGTGGLLVIISNNIVQAGTLSSNGSDGGSASQYNYDLSGAGGGSGAGCIVLISNSSEISGEYTVTGGAGGEKVSSSYSAKGGAGGNGTYANITVEDLVLVDPTEFQLALTSKSALENIEPSNGRLLGLIDGDELMYEYQGKRHRAVDTSGALDLSKIIPPGQRTPDEFEVAINDPQEGQVMRYNATNEQWENGDNYHVYSTDEHIVGKWINGKPVYEKTILGNNFNSTGDWSANHNISNLDEVVNVSSPLWYDSIDECWIGDSRMYFSGTKSSSYGVGGKIQITSTRISILQESGFAAVDWTNRTEKIRITIQYTKTTDTV